MCSLSIRWVVLILVCLLFPIRTLAQSLPDYSAIPLVQFEDTSVHHADGWAITPDCRFAAIGGEKTAILFDTLTGSDKSFTSPRYGQIMAVAISPDKKLLVVGNSDASILTYDIETGKQIAEFGFRRPIISLHFAPNGKLLTASESAPACFWEPTTGQFLREIPAIGTILGFSKDGGTFLCKQQGSIALVNSATGAVIRRFGNNCYGEVASSDLSFVAAGVADRLWRYLYVWNVATGQEVVKMQLLSGGTPICFNTDKTRLLVQNELSGGFFVDLKTGKPADNIGIVQGHGRFSPDNQTIVTVATKIGLDSINQVARINLAADERVHKRPDLRLPFAFSPDQKLMAKAAMNVLQIIEVQSGKVVQSLYGHAEGISAIAYSPDGTLLASSGGGNIIKIWETTTGTVKRTIPWDGPIGRLTFDASSRKLMVRWLKENTRTFSVVDIMSGETTALDLQHPALSIEELQSFRDEQNCLPAFDHFLASHFHIQGDNPSTADPNNPVIGSMASDGIMVFGVAPLLGSTPASPTRLVKLVPNMAPLTVPLPAGFQSMALSAKAGLLAIVPYAGAVQVYRTSDLNLLYSFAGSLKGGLDPSRVAFDREGKRLYIIERGGLVTEWLLPVAATHPPQK